MIRWKTEQSYLWQPNLVNLNRSTFCSFLLEGTIYSGDSTIAATISVVILIATATAYRYCISLQQRHHDLKNKLRSPTRRGCSSEALLIVSLQSRKFLFELSRPTVLAVFEDLLLNFCTNFVRVSSMSAPGNTDSSTVKIETGIPRYFLKRFSVRCWYRVQP